MIKSIFLFLALSRFAFAAAVVLHDDTIENFQHCQFKVPPLLKSYSIRTTNGATRPENLPNIGMSALSKFSQNFARSIMDVDLVGLDKVVFENYLTTNFVYGSFREVAKQNTGIIKYNQTILADQCFASMVKAFYGSLETEKSINRTRPSVQDVVGEGAVFSNKKPGWIWVEALKAAKGNKNLAMTLIGICGHDDTHHSGEDSSANVSSIDISPKISSEDVAALRSALKECQKKSIAMRTTGQTDSISFEKIRYEIQLLTDLLGNQKKLVDAIQCPDRSSIFYAPRSLGEDVDISSEMKKRIVTSHNDDILFNLNKSVPAKYYHIMGAAYMTCRNIRDGMGPSTASFIQSLSASSYRATRLCTLTAQDNLAFAELDRNWDKLSVKYLANVQDEKTWKQLNNIGIPNYFKSDEELLAKKIDALKAYLLATRHLRSFSPSGDDLKKYKKEYATAFGSFGEKAFDRIESKKRIDLAYSVFQRGASTLDQAAPDRDCILNVMQSQFSNDLVNRFSCNKDPKICAMAKRKLESWKVDLDWTLEAHKEGAEFAKRNCSKGDFGAEVKSLCAQSKNIESGSAGEPIHKVVK